MTQADYLRRIRFCLAIFIAGLVFSGITAFPLQTELGWLVSLLHTNGLRAVAQSTHLLPWVERVHNGLVATNAQYPFLAYGTDWLAFAHLVIAVAFVGPYLDPVRNKWVITFGLIACGAVIPLALIAGEVRGIPFGWRLIDCSFGLFGAVPLVLCTRLIFAMERKQALETMPAERALIAPAQTLFDFDGTESPLIRLNRPRHLQQGFMFACSDH